MRRSRTHSSGSDISYLSDGDGAQPSYSAPSRDSLGYGGTAGRGGRQPPDMQRPKPSKAEPVYKTVSDFQEHYGDYEGIENPFGEEGIPEEDEYAEEDDDQPARLLGPAMWHEVDTEELSESAAKLINNIVTTTLADENEQQQMPWQIPLPATNDAELMDPLGMGTLDIGNMTLGQKTQREGEVPHGLAAMMAGKGHSAVGRFINQLAANPRASFVAAQSVTGRSGQPLYSGGSVTIKARKASGGAKHTTIPLAKVLPNSEQFDPESYLSIFHEDTSMAALERGTKTLARELSERTGQLRQLVKSNFERFISCKDTIDDIYIKLRRLESEKSGGSGQQLYEVVSDVQEYACRAIGSVLTRHAKAERIRSVMHLLKRFNILFGVPRRITTLAEKGDYEQVVSEYHKTTALIKPSSKTARVWVSLYQEIEKRVTEVFQEMRDLLEDPLVGPDVAPDLFCHIAALQVEGLPAAKGCDPAVVYVAAQEAHLTMMTREVQADHDRRMQRLRDRFFADTSRSHYKDNAPPEVALLLWRGEDLDDRQLSPSSDQPLSGAGPLQAPTGAAPQDPAAPAPRTSLLVPHSAPTPGQQQWVRYLVHLTMVLLQGLPPFWQVMTHKKLSGMPTEAAQQLAAARVQADAVISRLLASYSAKATATLDALSSAGPLQQSMQVAISELCAASREMRAADMPHSVVSAMNVTLFSAVGRFVKNICRHLESVPRRLCELEEWRIDLTQQHPDPVTRLPEALRQEVGLAMSAYSEVLQECSAVAEVPADASWLVLHKGFFGLLEGYGAAVEKLVERIKGSADSSELQSKMRSLEAAAEGRADMPEDIKLLLILSNTAMVVLDLLPTMMEQYKPLLAAEAVGRKAARTTAAQQSERLRKVAVGILHLYVDRKKAMIAKVLAAYLRPDVWGAGAPLQLTDVSEACRELLHCLVVIRSEMHAYSPSNSHSVMPQLVGFLLGELVSGLTALPRDAPAEALLQRCLDLEFMGCVLAGLLQGDLEVQLDTAHQVLLNRLWDQLSSAQPAALESAPGLKELGGCSSSRELRKRIHKLCKQALVPLLARSAANYRCFSGGQEAAGTPTAGASQRGL